MAASELLSALAEIKQHQQLSQLTGAVHTAAWVVPGQGVQTVREDVGRHNALDKLIGLLIRIGKNPATGYVIVTSRASYELIQKAASVSITLLAAMSAPTGLAIRLAEEAGLTLVGFVRDNQHVVYTHAEHLNHTIYPTLIKKSNLMHIEKLISMANDIADFFNAESDKEIAAEGVKKHILRSWDPRMRKAIIKHYQASGEGLSPLATQAMKKLLEMNQQKV